MGGILKSNPLTYGIQDEYELNKQMADRAEDDARYEAKIRRDQAKKLKGEQISATAASGIELEGSAQKVIDEAELDAEIEAMNIVYGGQLKKYQMRREARNKRAQAVVSLGMQAAKSAGGGG